MPSFNDERLCFISKSINTENEEVFKLKKEKILEILFSLCEKNIVDINTIQSFNENIKNANTVEDLNEIEFDLIQTKKLEIMRRSLISYILDYKDDHLITDKTERVLLNKVYDINTIEELNIIEEEIELIIKEESTKINDEFNKLYKQFSIEDIEYQEIKELKK